MSDLHHDTSTADLRRLRALCDFIARTTWDVESIAPTRQEIEERRALTRRTGKDWDATNRVWRDACRECGERFPWNGGCCDCVS